MDDNIINVTTVKTSNFTSDNFSRLSVLEILEQNADYQAATTLIVWVFPLIVLVGTIGNALSFVIMIQREMRQTPTFFYLAALAIADTVMLYLSALKTWIRMISGFEMLHINNFCCKFLTFLIHFSIHFSAWLIVAVTVERFLAVWFPLKANTMCSVSRARFVTFMTALIFILINIHVLWTAELLPAPNSINPDKLICAAYAYQNFVCNVFPWINLVLYSFLPFAILLVLNSLIVVCLVRNQNIVTSSMTKDDRFMRNTHRKLAITLLAISFVWIITTIPRPLYQLFSPKPKSFDDMARGVLGKVICFLLMYANHSINFFLYCLTGQRFRIELSKFVRQCQRKQNPPVARLRFKSSGSGSGNSTAQDSSIPLVSTPCADKTTFD